MLVLALSGGAAADLVSNGGFEIGDGGSPADPAAWTEYGPDLTGERSASYRRSGAYSAKRWTGGDGQEYGYFQSFTVSPGQEFEATGYLFSPSSDALSGSSYSSLKLEFYSGQNLKLSTSESARLTRATSGFQRYSIAAVAPASAATGRVVFAVGAGASPHGGAAYCDDVTVTLVPDFLTDEEFLDLLQRRMFEFFWRESSPLGLIKDRANNFRQDAYTVSSIASVGFGLSAICIAQSRGWVSREEARARVVTTLETFRDTLESQQGFFYHFINMNTGQAAPGSEVSTIDTALLIYGALLAGEYFEARYGDSVPKAIADEVYRRVNWPARHAGGGTYSEYMMMDLLAIGSPTYPLSPARWAAIDRNFQDAIATRTWDHSYPRFFYSSLFTHQYPQCYLDFRFRRDAYNGQITYFDSSRNMTRSNRQYCLDHSMAHGIAAPKSQTFGETVWGLTAADGPDGYFAYGEAEPDLPEPQGSWRLDGTAMPHGPGGSVMFAPDICVPALRHMRTQFADRVWGRYGFIDSFNVDRNWWASDVIGIDLGAMILSIENYRTGLPWRYLTRNASIRRALDLVGFQSARQPCYDDFDDGAPDSWGGACPAGSSGGHSEYVDIDPFNSWVGGKARRLSSESPGGVASICLNGYSACYDDAVTFWLRGDAALAGVEVEMVDSSGGSARTGLAGYAQPGSGWQWVSIPLNAFSGVRHPSLAMLSFRFAEAGWIEIDYLAFLGTHPDSSGLPAASVAEAARLPDGTPVSFRDLVVTENFGTFLYAQQSDRAAGIRLDGSFAFIPGDVIQASGTVGQSGAERALEGVRAVRSTHGSPALPLGVRACAMYENGLPTQGLYVTTWGRAGVASGDEFRLLDDCGGSARVWAPGLPKPPEGAMVVMTGVAGAAADEGGEYALIRVRGIGGIRVEQ